MPLIFSVFAPFYLMKNPTKMLHNFGLDCGLWELFKYSTYEPYSKIKFIAPAFFGDRFGGKDCVLYTYNPSADLMNFCMKWLRTLNCIEN